VLALGLLIILGLLGAKIGNKLKFPMVTGFIIVGILLSPSISGVISESILEKTSPITDIALGIIAFLVGGSLSMVRLRRLSKQILWITMVQATMATIFVAVLVFLLTPSLISLEYHSLISMALILGAVSAATAPAATLAIVHEYRAKGPLTTTLLAVVALDDAVCIIYFVLCVSLAEIAIKGSITLHSIVQPLISIVLSVILGILFAFLSKCFKRIVHGHEEILTTTLGLIFIASGASKVLGADPLLTNMVFGFIVENYIDFETMFTVLEKVENVIFALFFTLAGTHFNLDIMRAALPLALIIVAGRFSGKYIGSYIGGAVSKAPKTIKKYVGLGLLPKAGVTVGLILFAAEMPLFEQFMGYALNAILASVILNELIAPPLTKYAIFKAGEAYRA